MNIYSLYIYTWHSAHLSNFGRFNVSLVGASKGTRDISEGRQYLWDVYVTFHRIIEWLWKTLTAIANVAAIYCNTENLRPVIILSWGTFTVKMNISQLEFGINEKFCFFFRVIFCCFSICLWDILTINSSGSQIFKRSGAFGTWKVFTLMHCSSNLFIFSGKRGSYNPR